MKLPILILLFLLPLTVVAPDSNVLFLPKETIYYDPMLLAFMKVESNFRTDVMNSGGYTGILQISPIMIEEVNRLNRILKRFKTVYTLSDRLDSLKSVRIWYAIQNRYNKDYSLERAAKVWNPTADSRYLERLKFIQSNI